MWAGSIMKITLSRQNFRKNRALRQQLPVGCAADFPSSHLWRTDFSGNRRTDRDTGSVCQIEILPSDQAGKEGVLR